MSERDQSSSSSPKKRRSRSTSKKKRGGGSQHRGETQKKSKPKSRSGYRLFMAIYPPRDCVESWLTALRGVDGLPAYRMTPEDQVHLTVQFIGDRPKSDLPKIIESAEHAWGERAPFMVRATSIGLFPDAARAKVIAAHLELPPELVDLKRRLVHRMARRPRQDGSDVTGFRPHCTLGRFQKMPRFDDEPQFPALDDVGGQLFPVERIVVVKSTLTPDGPIHDRIASLPFEAYDDDDDDEA